MKLMAYEWNALKGSATVAVDAGGSADLRACVGLVKGVAGRLPRRITRLGAQLGTEVGS
ncbi:hypothetical protein [Streptomyces venezuelae]